MLDPRDKEFQEQDKFDTQDLLELMAFLRSEDGFPWERAHDHESIQEIMLDEA